MLTNWFDRFYHKVNDVPEIWKIPPDFRFSLCWLFCRNEIWKIENNHQVSIFHSIGCIVKIDQLIWKVNITVITTLETDWPQEVTLSGVILCGLGTRPLHELKLSFEPGLSVLDFV